MLCPNCHQTVTPGTPFCGNCGFALTPTSPAPAAQAFQPNPNMAQPMAVPIAAEPSPQVYVQPQVNNTAPMIQPAGVAPAMPNGEAYSSKREIEAVLSLILGILGCVGWLFMLAIGIVLGLLAIVFGTLSIHSKKGVLAKIGIGLGVVAIAVSLFFWVKAAENLAKTGSITGSSDSTTLQTVSTPCYTTKIPSNIKVVKTAGSCTFQAINNTTQEAYLVFVSQQPSLTPANLDQLGTSAMQQAINSYPGNSIVSENSSTFAGSPAFLAHIASKTGGNGDFDYIYHNTSQGDFVLVVHDAGSNQSYNLDSLESNWSWE